MSPKPQLWSEPKQYCEHSKLRCCGQEPKCGEGGKAHCGQILVIIRICVETTVHCHTIKIPLQTDKYIHTHTHKCPKQQKSLNEITFMGWKLKL